MNDTSETIVFFGDSLTLADYLPRGFVDILAERWSGDRVLNRGVNGDTADDLLARIDEVVAEHPDRVFLMIGTNDCGWGVPAAHYRNNLRLLIASLRPAEIILIPPTTSAFMKGVNGPFVAAVKDVAGDEGLPVIDFATAIQDSDYDIDGLHWNASGHKRLAEMIDAWRREEGR